MLIVTKNEKISLSSENETEEFADIISKKIMPKAMENYNPNMRNNRGVIIFDYRG